MTLVATNSKYGLGRENTPGTAVAPGNQMYGTKGGIPIEGYLQLNMGDQVVVHPKMLGLPFDVEYSRIHVGKTGPSVPTMDHNIHQAILEVLVASMTGRTAYAANMATLRPGADGLIYKAGVASQNNYTFTVRHEPGSAASDNMLVAGCVCSRLQLTFPQGGGPVRMAWDALGMVSDYEAAAASAGTFGYPAAATLDHLCSEFRFFIGPSGAPVEFYPDGDVVVTIVPRIQVQLRTRSTPQVISIDRYDVTAQFKFPWDADADVNTYHALVAGETLRHLHITKAYSSAWGDDPNADGEWSLSVLGVQEAPPVTGGGEGIVGETVTLRGIGGSGGSTYDWPFIFKFYDATTFVSFP